MATSKKDPVEAGKELRLMALTTSPQKLGFVADKDCPNVYGVITDWNLSHATASILAMKDGTASLYTTSTFGIIGGHGHEPVRRAAQICVKTAQRFYDKSLPVSEYPYPGPGKVNFYLLTYQGVRLCVGDEDAIRGGTDPTLSLFASAQDVLTALRIVTEPAMKRNAQPGP